MPRQLNPEDMKTFFQKVLDQYKLEVEKAPANVKAKLKLYSNMPVKIELLFDKDYQYCSALISKNNKSEFSVESFQDVFMVVAVSNSKKFEYGSKGNFLYLFQTTARRFDDWDVQKFTQDLVNYELVEKPR